MRLLTKKRKISSRVVARQVTPKKKTKDIKTVYGQSNLGRSRII